jgi:cellulose synthase/poly-beta-1,6-N-acetylglucosamine synthase-like glycosyltransferase
MNRPRLSVVIPTRNPDPSRLAQVLRGLGQQSLPAREFEVCIVDNGSMPELPENVASGLSNAVVVRELVPGLLAARLRGIKASKAPHIVFIDDDTIPEENFLRAAAEFMDCNPDVGTAGGRILPKYLVDPPPWLAGFAWALALRDSGTAGLRWSAAQGGPLPNWTPIGAGLLVRREAVIGSYLQHAERHQALIERLSWAGQGAGGVEDKDLVLHTLRAGWTTAYVPAMQLTHLIPAGRLTVAYFEKLLPTLQTLWAQTIYAHGFAEHTPVHPATLLLRKAKAWIAFRAWRSTSNRLNWLAACGYLAGLAHCFRDGVRYPAPPVEAHT